MSPRFCCIEGPGVGEIAEMTKKSVTQLREREWRCVCYSRAYCGTLHFVSVVFVASWYIVVAHKSSVIFDVCTKYIV